VSEYLNLAHCCSECGADLDYVGPCDACSRPPLSLRAQAEALLSQYSRRQATPVLLEQIQTATGQWLERVLANVVTAGELQPPRPQVSISSQDGRVDIYFSRRSDIPHLRRAGFDMMGFARLHDLRIEVGDNDHRLIGWLLFRS